MILEKIWKFKLRPISGSQKIWMPEGARILCVKVQQDEPCIWAVVDSFKASQPEQFQERNFFFLMTGGDYPPISELSYIGTLLLTNETFVVHIFEKKEN